MENHFSQAARTKRQLNIEEVKRFIESCDLVKLRELDICLKGRKQKIVENNEEPFEPFQSLAVSTIRGKEYLYLYKYINGKNVGRIFKQSEIKNFNFKSVKISPRAKNYLQEHYNLHF